MGEMLFWDYLRGNGWECIEAIKKASAWKADALPLGHTRIFQASPLDK